MKYEINTINSVRKEAVITIAKEDVSRAEEKVLNYFCKDVKMPGFRKGKVPMSIVKSRFAKEVDEQLDKELANQAYTDLQKEENFNVFSIVKFDVNDDDDGNKIITITIDLKPEFELIDYKNIELNEPEIEVSEDDINEEIEGIRKYNAEFVETTEKAKAGDFVRLEYEGKFDDGSLVAEKIPQTIFGSQKNTWEEAGETNRPGIKAIVEGIVGMGANDEKTVEMNFEGDEFPEDLRGKKVTYQLKVFEVRERKMPELNEEFFKKLNVTSLEDLKEKIKTNIHNRKLQELRFEQREFIVQKLLETVTFEVPESAQQLEQIHLIETIYRQQLGHSMTPEQLQEKHQEIFEETKEVSLDKAKINFILEKISEKENIKVSEQEMSQMIMQEAMLLRVTPEQLVNELKGNRDRIEDLQRRAIFGKTLDFVLMSNLKKNPEALEENSSENSSGNTSENAETEKVENAE